MRDSGAVLPQVDPRGFDPSKLLAPEQALIAYFARVQLSPVGIERVPLDAAYARVLAGDAIAREDLPAHPRSTMDGFAVASAGALRLRIVGDVAMGRAAPRAIGADETLRSPTGGALPDGADAVVPLEDVVEDGGFITLRGPVPPGDCLTPRAADMRAGEVLLQGGRTLGGPEMGVLATLGISCVDVFKRPRFGVVSTGDELIDVSGVPGAGQVRDSNRFAVAGALRAMGVDPVQLPRVPDDPEEMRAVLRAALEECDGVVLTGGSSVGERDFTPRVVGELGLPGVVVHGIRVKPGKPTLLGAAHGKPVLGLPGNPASALMILEAVVRPIIAACTGRRPVAPGAIDAIASEAFAGRPGWTWFVPVRVVNRNGRLHAAPFTIRSSHVSLLSRASGYVTIGEGAPRIEAGDVVRVSLFSAGGAPIENER
jgi:molybdenum cofactor synthesis domain-containing protein